VFERYGAGGYFVIWVLSQMGKRYPDYPKTVIRLYYRFESECNSAVTGPSHTTPINRKKYQSTSAMNCRLPDLVQTQAPSISYQQPKSPTTKPMVFDYRPDSDSSRPHRVQKMTSLMTRPCWPSSRRKRSTDRFPPSVRASRPQRRCQHACLAAARGQSQ
jgi:hypothetical protein